MRAQRNFVLDMNAKLLIVLKAFFCIEKVYMLHWHFNDQWTGVFQHKWMIKK